MQFHRQRSVGCAEGKRREEQQEQRDKDGVDGDQKGKEGREEGEVNLLRRVSSASMAEWMGNRKAMH